MSKRSCRRALEANHGPVDGGYGSLFGSLGPPGPFFAVSENSLFRAKFRPPTWPQKASFLHPLEGPKNQICDQTLCKIPLWRLGPKRALCKSTWAAEGPPKEPFLAPWTVPMPIPFCTGFSFAAVILPGPPFSIQAAPREPRFSQMYTIHIIKHNISNGHLDAPEG